MTEINSWIGQGSETLRDATGYTTDVSDQVESGQNDVEQLIAVVESDDSTFEQRSALSEIICNMNK